MKSIVEEAPSIVKAIEKAWSRAGKPAEFSVRIFELPQKGFLGFTAKSAKIGLFFEDGKRLEPKPTRPERPKPKRPAQPKPKKPTPRVKKTEADQEPWNKEMVAYAQSWLNGLLQTVAFKDARFTINPQRYHLKITFDEPIFEQDEQNRALFRNCAHLLLQSTRNKFKRPLKGFKVVLTTT